MKDERKTKRQMIDELNGLRRQIDEMQSVASNTGRMKTPVDLVEDNKFKIIFHQSRDALVLLSAESGRIIEFNPAAHRMFGHEQNHLIGKDFKDLFYVESTQDLAKFQKEFRIYGTAFTRTYLHSDGSKRYLELTAAIIPWNSGQAILAAARDVTERKAAEAQIAELLKQAEKNNDDLLSILNMLNLGIATLDEDGQITFINKTAYKMTGAPKRKILGKNWVRVLPFQKQYIPRIKDMLRRPASKRRTVEAKFEIPGRKRYWLEVEIKDDPRNPDKKIIVLYDISEVYDLRHLLEKRAKFQDIVGKSEPMQMVYKRIKEVSSVDWTVLIEGETGTGKELVARAIHATSHRRDKPFIAVNCAGLEDSLLTSQLFGHRRGAFTGAVEDHRGFFEVASGGTLFLDEIGDISRSMQANLLRVLEEKEIIRVGESSPRQINVRILTATHRNLSQAIENGKFRRDLFYRIRVARITLPPLQERREDIPLLCETFLAQGCAVTGKNVQRLSDDALRMLLNYHWPGNVRELKSVVESAILGCKGTVIHIKDLPFEIVNPEALNEVPEPAYRDDRDGMIAALANAGDSRTKAARLLGMSRATFYRRLNQYGIKSSK